MRRNRTSRWLRLSGRILLVLLAASAALLAGSWLYLRSGLPLESGHIAVAGLAGEVRIARDRYGVPVITAGSETDGAFALGYLHAAERFAQMDLQRRYGQGRLAEIVGEQAVTSDRFMRTLGVAALAERQFARLGPEARTLLEAYAAGINAQLRTRRGALQPDYYLLRTGPEPWRPADSLLWGKLMALQLAGNYRGEILRARLAQRLDTLQLQELYPEHPDSPTALGMPELGRELPLAELAALRPEGGAPAHASNNWVVDGRRTPTGKPLLANDPHLGFAAPGTWYLARIETPSLTLTGATAPGTPLLVIGHNGRVAWGFTTTTGDVEDLYVERIDPANPGRYVTPGGSEPFVTRRETIRVRGGDDVALTVRSTRHGPVISDAVTVGRGVLPAAHVLALRAAWLDEEDDTPQALFAMNRAADAEQFHEALRSFHAPQQSIVFADRDGRIGFKAAAKIPIRRSGEGWLPSPGWTDTHDWLGYVPFDELPGSLDPPEGRIVTANNKIVDEGYPHFISRDWDLPYRARRIQALLDQASEHSVPLMAEIQADILSLGARDLVPLLLRTPPSGDRAAAAMNLLRGWDHRMQSDRPEPTLYMAWLRAVLRALIADELGPLFSEYGGFRHDVIRSILTRTPRWCDDVATDEVEDCDGRLSLALDWALDDLAGRLGGAMEEWRWGRVHEARFEHPLFTRVLLLDRLVGAAVATDGGNDTVNVGTVRWRDEKHPYAHLHGASLRVIYDLADLERSRFMITPGQSGNVLSTHFDDLVRPWRGFRWLDLVNRVADDVLVLAPP